MASATLTSKGQITLPKPIRELLGVKQGDRVAFRVSPDGKVLVEADSVDLLQLQGCVHPRKLGVSIEDMSEVIRRSGSRQ
jgi:AbrB family looped-hinge helix DNA binding protein